MEEDYDHEEDFDEEGPPNDAEEIDGISNDHSEENEGDDVVDDDLKLLKRSPIDDPTTQHRYPNKLCKPVYKSGTIKIGLSKAKLYGLVNEKGQVEIKPKNYVSPEERLKMKDHASYLAKPKGIDPSQIVDEEKLSFQPKRSKEAERAMKNKKCGYDFVNKIDVRGNFMERTFQEQSGKGLSKWELESLKQDYEVSQDKLICPVCKKPQSFDQFIDKKRTCTQCNVKFEKLNVTSGINFQKRIAQKENERIEKLRRREVELYGADVESYVLPKPLVRSQDERKPSKRPATMMPARMAEAKGDKRMMDNPAESKPGSSSGNSSGSTTRPKSSSGNSGSSSRGDQKRMKMKETVESKPSNPKKGPRLEKTEQWNRPKSAGPRLNKTTTSQPKVRIFDENPQSISYSVDQEATFDEEGEAEEERGKAMDKGKGKGSLRKSHNKLKNIDVMNNLVESHNNETNKINQTLQQIQTDYAKQSINNRKMESKENRNKENGIKRDKASEMLETLIF